MEDSFYVVIDPNWGEPKSVFSTVRPSIEEAWLAAETDPTLSLYSGYSEFPLPNGTPGKRDLLQKQGYKVGKIKVSIEPSEFLGMENEIQRISEFLETYSIAWNIIGTSNGKPKRQFEKFGIKGSITYSYDCLWECVVAGNGKLFVEYEDAEVYAQDIFKEKMIKKINAAEEFVSMLKEFRG